MFDTLDITELTIHPTRFPESKIRALCTATFNHALTVTGIRIIQGKKGIFVRFPVLCKSTTCKPRPIVFPSCQEARKTIEGKILASYVINHCVNDYRI